MKRNKNAVKGFTLIELVIVMALLAILAALGVYTFAGVRSSAADDAAYKKLDSIEDAFLYSRTTNGYDNDKAIKNVDTLVSVEGTYTIDAKDDHYKIVYTENNKDYIAENDLYSYSKPGGSGEGGGGSGGGGGGGGTTDPDNPDNPDNPDKPDKPSTPEEGFIMDSNDLYLNTAEVADKLKEFYEKNEGKYSNWIDMIKDFIKENDLDIKIESTENNMAMYEFISKFYYDGSWPTLPKELLTRFGYKEDDIIYIRPTIDYPSLSPDDKTIILYASPNKDLVDNGTYTNLIFLGERKQDSAGKYYVTGTWYYKGNSNVQIAPYNQNRYITELLVKQNWKPVELDINI